MLARLRLKHTLLPLAAIQARPLSAWMILASYTAGFSLYGLVERINALLNALSQGHRSRFVMQAGSAILISLGLLTILTLTSLAIAQSVRSRLRELAILKAIGFSSGRMVGAVFLEAAMPAALGTIFGLALSWPLALAVLRLMLPHTGQAAPLLASPQLSALCLLLASCAAALIALLSVVAPAARVVRLNVAPILSR